MEDATSGGAVEAPKLRPRLSAAAALGSRLASRLLGIVFVVYLARAESAATFAAYSYLLVLATTVGTLADAGISNIAGREVARGLTGLATAYRGGAPIALGAGVLAGLGVSAFGLADSGPGSSGAALAATSAFICFNLFFGYQAELLRATGRPTLEATLQIAGAVLQLGLGVAIIAAGGNVATLLTALALKELALVAAAQAFLPWPWRGERRPGWRRELFKMGLWISGATAAVAVMLRVPQIVLSNAAAIDPVAHYAAASRILDISMIFTTTLATALFPWVAQRAFRDEGFLPRFERLTLLGVVAVTAATAALAPAVPPIIRLAFGDDYAPAGSPAQILMFTTPVLVGMFAAWTVLVAIGRERLVALSTLAGIAGTAVTGVWVADDPTAARAAYATVISLAAAAVCMLVALVVVGRRRDPAEATADV